MLLHLLMTLSTSLVEEASTAKISETWVHSSCPVSYTPFFSIAASSFQADQRWYMFQKMGPAPTARSGHAMASMGSRVFVLGGLGGESLSLAKPEDPSMVHVLDTSTCYVHDIAVVNDLTCQPQNILNTPQPDHHLQRNNRQPFPHQLESHRYRAQRCPGNLQMVSVRRLQQVIKVQTLRTLVELCLPPACVPSRMEVRLATTLTIV